MKYAYTSFNNSIVKDNDTGTCIPVSGGCGDEFYALQAWLAAGNVPDAYVPPPTPDPTVFSKLQIRRACRRLGFEDELDGLLASSMLFQKDWADASEIDLNDAVTVQALAQATIDVQAVIAEIIHPSA